MRYAGSILGYSCFRYWNTKNIIFCGKSKQLVPQGLPLFAKKMLMILSENEAPQGFTFV